MNHIYEIKPIFQEDTIFALKLVWEVFKEFELPDYSEEGVEEFHAYIQKDNIEERMQKGDLYMYGAFDRDKVVGVIAIRPPGHISLLFVDKDYHRKGIAKSLLQTSLNLCKAQFHSDKMTVHSSPYAVEIYHRLGFEDTDVEKTVNGLRFVPMKLEI